MLDEDIPSAHQGDQNAVVFRRNGAPGFLALPQTEDLEPVVNALGRDVEVECVLRGVSANAAGMLRLRLRNPPRGQMRESLLRWLADNGN